MNSVFCFLKRLEPQGAVLRLALVLTAIATSLVSDGHSGLLTFMTVANSVGIVCGILLFRHRQDM
jgi:hypothetical protein